MTDIPSLPPEVLLHVFTFLPSSDLIRVRRLSRQWRDLSQTALISRIQSSWPNPGYWPSAVEVRIAANLIKSGDLTEELMTTLATRIQSSWSIPGYLPSVTEVYCAAALECSGHLRISVR